jgi:hypothetical protein
VTTHHQNHDGKEGLKKKKKTLLDKSITSPVWIPSPTLGDPYLVHSNVRINLFWSKKNWKKGLRRIIRIMMARRA